MARTSRKTTLDTAKRRRMRPVNLPISSAGMDPPGPHPGPSRAAEKSAYDGETNSHGNEPGHDPPGKRLVPQAAQPAFLLLPAGVGEHQKCRDQSGGSKNRPGMKNREKRKKNKRDQQGTVEVLTRAVRPERAAFNVDVEVWDDDERDDHERRNQDSRDERRKEVQQFLEAEKIPWGLGGIGSEERIGELFEWGIPEERGDHHGNDQHLKRDGFANQEVGKSHQLRPRVADNLGGGLLGDKDDAARLFLCVGAESRRNFTFVHLCPFA